jgi:small-conductance mechanosensitive channel
LRGLRSTPVTNVAYNGHLKIVFDERNIEIPFPQQTIWLGEAKDGSTQRFHIEAESGVTENDNVKSKT